MDNLYFRIKAIRPAVTDGQFRLIDRGSGPEIDLWLHSSSVPTEAELLSANWQRAAQSAAAARAIENAERSTPITHRGQREQSLTLDLMLRLLRDKINALDAEIAALTSRSPDPLPAIPVTHMIKVIKVVDDAIKAERAKL